METLGVLFFLFVMGMGFWVLIFLATFIPYWLTLVAVEKVNPELAAKLAFFDTSKEEV